MALLKKWLWEKSGFTLAILIFASLIAGWGLPDTANLVMAMAIAQIIMAVVVVVKEINLFPTLN